MFLNVFKAENSITGTSVNGSALKRESVNCGNWFWGGVSLVFGGFSGSMGAVNLALQVFVCFIL